GVGGVSGEASTTNARGTGPFTPALTMADAFNPFALTIPLSRSHGITHALIPARGPLLSGQGALVSLGHAGEFQQPRDFGLFLDVSRYSARAFKNSDATQWMRLRDVFADAR